VYENIPGRPSEYASTILAYLALVVTIPIYVFYKNGPKIRAKSKFAESLDASRKKNVAKRSGSVVSHSEKRTMSEKQLLERV
jgi:hypothetical protein